MHKNTVLKISIELLSYCIWLYFSINLFWKKKKTVKKLSSKLNLLKRFKPNHSVINKKQRDPIQFSPEKTDPKKEKWIQYLWTHHASWWILSAIR